MQRNVLDLLTCMIILLYFNKNVGLFCSTSRAATIWDSLSILWIPILCFKTMMSPRSITLISPMPISLKPMPFWRIKKIHLQILLTFTPLKKYKIVITFHCSTSLVIRSFFLLSLGECFAL